MTENKKDRNRCECFGCKWTPMSEHPPEEKGDYLVQDMCDPPHIFVCKWRGECWNVKAMIDAWRPLPEPYRGGTKISERCRTISLDELIQALQGKEEEKTK